MNKRKPLPDLNTSEHMGRSKSKMEEKTVDIELHKKMMKKFMKLHRRMQSEREQRSVEYF